MRVSDFSMLWTPKLDSVGSSYNGQLSRLHRTPPTISDHLQLHPPTLWCHSDAHCVSLHNHATPVTGLNSDQCLISPDFVPMSWATAYLSFSPYAAFACCIFIDDNC